MLTVKELNQRRAFAKETVFSAGRVLQRLLKETIVINDKDNNPLDIISNLDLEINEYITERIQNEFPQDQLLSEESNPLQDTFTSGWVLDPIDGTNGCTRNLPFYAVVLAYVHHGVPCVSSIYAPGLSLMAEAQLAYGSYINGQRISVSTQNILRNSHLAYDYSYHDRIWQTDSTVRQVADKTKYCFSLASASVALLFLANGQIDGYIHCSIPGIWDIAAGALLVQEAGGKVTDFFGDSIDYTQPAPFSLLVSNGLVHDELRRALEVRLE